MNNETLQNILEGRSAAAICCRSQEAFHKAHRWAVKMQYTSLLVAYGDWGWVSGMAAELSGLKVLTDSPSDPRLSGQSILKVDSLTDPIGLGEELNWPELLSVVFTSGSTGKPKAFGKRASALKGEFSKAFEVLGPAMKDALFLTTLPLEHTFGYTYGYLLPRLIGADCRLERVVTPNQFKHIDASTTRPLWIITTPTHMKHCAELGISLRNVGGVVCATSPLTTSLAKAAAKCFGVPITECYGSTETGTIAFRKRYDDETSEPPWELLPGAALQASPSGSMFSTFYLPEPVTLGDLLETEEAGFRILGRADDVIKVFGKRHSLSALNQLLSGLDMVKDSAYFMPDAASSEDEVRPAAMVVLKESASLNDVLSALRGKVDDLFIPRPIFSVDSLPRGETGKIRREELVALYKRCLTAE